MLNQILQRLEAAPEVARLTAAAAQSDDNIVVTEIRGGAPSALLALFALRLARPILVVTSSLERAEALTDGACFFGARPLLFPGFDTLPFEHAEPVLHITAARHRVFAIEIVPSCIVVPKGISHRFDRSRTRLRLSRRLGRQALQHEERVHRRGTIPARRPARQTH